MVDEDIENSCEKYVGRVYGVDSFSNRSLNVCACRSLFSDNVRLPRLRSDAVRPARPARQYCLPAEARIYRLVTLL
jgi:hypothetical protein